MATREAADITAPDGCLLGGERVVRKGGVVLFQRSWWQLPKNFADRGEYVWVHELSAGDDNLEVAPPGYRNFYAAQNDGKTVLCPRTSRADAKPGIRNATRKAWASRMASQVQA